jgi:hypothetical protein
LQSPSYRRKIRLAPSRNDQFVGVPTMRHEEDNFIDHYNVWLIIVSIFVFFIYLAWRWT